ncbi:DNA-dependent RNA polymerase [Tanacetum coccineum]
MRKRQISFRRPSLKRDTWQSFVATFVNFIHQKDAYIAMQVVLQLLIKAIPIYTVHDNFITTAGYSDLIAKCYSQVFLSMKTPLYIINQFLISNLFEPLLEKQHPKIEYNEMVIAREKQEGKEQENKEDEKDKKKKKKPRKKLTDGEIYMYQKEWWKLGNLIQAVDPNEVIPTNVLYAILDKNMPICDPSTGVEWSPAKNKAWKEKISSTVKAYESFTKKICGERNYPEDGGKNHRIMYDRFKRLLKTEGSQPLTCVHY